MTEAAPASGGQDSKQQQQQTSHVWEESTNTWENAVREDSEGRIIVAGGDTTADIIRKRRKRLEQNDYAQRNRRVVRDMIRYVYVLIDSSRWVRQKDPVLPPNTKLEVSLQLLQEFVQEYYDQNPLSHLGFVSIKNGEAEILTKLSSSSKAHKLALQSLLEGSLSEGPSGGGEFSLQNGLEVAGRSLGHQPRHGSREILIVCGALSTCDPGHILTETLPVRKHNIPLCVCVCLCVCRYSV
jgi:transcription initiation factor TFIIH subunit 2